MRGSIALSYLYGEHMAIASMQLAQLSINCENRGIADKSNKFCQPTPLTLSNSYILICLWDPYKNDKSLFYWGLCYVTITISRNVTLFL